MIKIAEILTPSMKKIHHEMGDTRALWQRRLSAESDFCKAVLRCGYLTQEQMQRAVSRYRLGRSRDGGVIFWQIDEQERVRDGKIMYYQADCHRDRQRHPNWVSYLLKKHYGYKGEVKSTHCLFGLHLLSLISHLSSCDDNRIIAVVEAEKTAVIMSELLPQYIWMACGGLRELSAEKLRPLHDHRVMLFPDTDPHREAFTLWYDVAQEARRLYDCDIRVSDLLERHASAEQKARKIDIVDCVMRTER